MTDTGSRSTYHTIAESLRTAILAGEFPYDRQLPTEAELAKEWEVGRQTVRQAFAQLVAENLVYRVRGRGTFATPRWRPGAMQRSFGSIRQLLGLSEDSAIEVVEPFHNRIDVEAAGRLQLQSDTVTMGAFLRFHLAEPFLAAATYMPTDVGQLLTAREDLYQEIRDAASVTAIVDASEAGPIVGAYESITAVALPEEIAPLIERLPGEPGLRIDRTYFDRTGRMIELAINHVDPRRFSYRLELRRSSR